MNGLLISQIGYDLKDPMRSIIRSSEYDYIKLGTVFEILEELTGETVLRGEVKYWGELWKSNWWEMDFSALDKEGTYKIIVKNHKDIITESDWFKVGEFLLWEETIKTVAIEQFEERARVAPHGKMGWKDCGSNMKELNSHATMIIGMCDLLAHTNCLPEDDVDRLVTQLMNGCDYLGACQDKALRVGFPEGSMVHEIPNHILVIPGDVAQGVVALAYASRLLTIRNCQKSDEYLERAIKAYDYLIKTARPYGEEGFSHSNHGADINFKVPDEWMTRDLLMMMWGGIELWNSGKTQYKRDVVKMGRQVMDRQVPESKKEGEYYGHFYVFDKCDFTEKANTHHHIGHDTGSTFPHYIIPFIEMASRWYTHPDVQLWRDTVNKFAYGYFLPACSKNPFYILPEGYFKNQGILTFCGPWHGINTSLAFGAGLAAKLEAFTGDMSFRKISVGNLQWIAGLNSGITKQTFKGSVIWREEIEEGKVEARSLIYGIGNKYAGCWSKIKGSISNGFCANPQFQLTVEPTIENDGPWCYSDEDWIPHSAGWISALSILRDIKFFRDIPAIE